MKRGAIVVVAARGAYTGKPRPAVVVQSDLFTKHSGNLSFVGQESKDFTYRLCRMNLFIHGINGNHTCSR